MSDRPPDTTTFWRAMATALLFELLAILLLYWIAH
jgi:hypothetical protein